MGPLLVLSLLPLLLQGPPAPPQTRAAIVEQQQAEKARSLTAAGQPPGQSLVARAERVFADGIGGLTPTFGGVRAGSGFAPGVAFTQHAGDAKVKVRALWSWKDTRRFDGAFTLPVAASRARLDAFWEKAPHARRYPVGMADAEATDDPLRVRGASGAIELPYRRLGVTAGAGYLQGTSDAVAPSSWGRAWLGLALDTRTAPEYTRRGVLLSADAERLNALQRANTSFNIVTVDVRHYRPLLNEHWIVAAQLRGQFSDAAEGTPYFLLPSIGGGATLRGYPSFRFRDRQTLIGRLELRWTAARSVDFAAFADRGSAAWRIRDLRRDEVGAWGAGIRFHSDRATGLRVDVARGREGWQIHLSRQASF